MSIFFYFVEICLRKAAAFQALESRFEVVIIRSCGNELTGDLIYFLGFQIKDMALKASGAYRHCKPCAGSSAGASGRHHPYHHRGGSGGGFRDSDAASGSGRFHYAYRRAAGAGGGGSSGDATPSMSARTDFLAGDEEEPEEEDDEMLSGDGACKEDNAKEWVAQVEPGVLITFVSLPQGGNDLKRIRFRSVLLRHCVCLSSYLDFFFVSVHYSVRSLVKFVCKFQQT